MARVIHLMRLFAVLFTVIVAVPPAHAQDTQASSAQPRASAPKDSAQANLPVSLDKIKEALKQPPALSLRSLDETPTFRMQILEKQKIEATAGDAVLEDHSGSVWRIRAGRRPLWIRAAATDVSGRR